MPKTMVRYIDFSSKIERRCITARVKVKYDVAPARLLLGRSAVIHEDHNHNLSALPDERLKYGHATITAISSDR